MTRFADIFAALAAPFGPNEVKSRSGGGGRQLYYVTATTVANRLDDVLGPESWDFEVAPWGENALIGTLVIRLPDGSVVRKSNVGGKAEMQAADDDAKIAASDCLKRCASLLGIARYLYRDGVPRFVQERVTGTNEQLSAQPEAPAQGRRPENGHAPEPRKERDKWGHPAATPPTAAAANGHGGQGGGNGHGRGGTPRSGKALFAWTKEQEQLHAVGLLKYINGWAKLQEFPGRMVDWDAEQVQLAYAEAVSKLQSIRDSGTEAYEDALSN